METADPLLGTDVGRYRLERLLGEGGMGQVYLGVQPAIGSRVAVKILSDQCARNPELLERFFAEAKAVNLVRHENIVGVLDLAQLPDGRPYIVMEFVEGHTLGVLVRSGQAPLGGIVQVMQEVLSALGAAHQLGIVHRDLKPDNIIVTGEGHAKVLDFGIAKLAPGLGAALSPRTRTGALLGTPAYMAPEQISGAGNVDSRADIYAAGIVLFEAVTGKVPFHGETLYDLMRAHLEVAPPRPRELRADLPQAFEDVILQALAKSPDDRFQSTAAMASALQHAASQLGEDQWVKLSSRGGVMTGRPSLQRTAPDPARAPTGVATPVPGPPPSPKRRTGRWVALAAVIAAAGGVALIAMSRDESESAPSPTIAIAAPSPPPTRTVPAPPAPPPPATTTAPPPAPPPRPAGGRAPAVAQPTIAGGGSAADHGVYIGPNVQIGSNVVIGGGTPAPAQSATSFTRPSDYDPRKFDAVAYAPKALALARSVFPDAQLAEYEIDYVFPSGLADLTKGDHESSYQFRSPSHSVRPADLPKNVNAEIKCYVEVTVHPTEVEVRVRDLDPIDTNCKWPGRPLPRCSLAKVWAKAQADGAKPDTVARIGFLHDGGWFFDNEFDGEGLTKSYADDCR